MRRVSEQKADKRAAKKREIGEYAVQTLAQLGYANTSLRDIADQCGVSVGVIHYYFEDKSDLISYCVEEYKAQFVARMQEIVDSAGSQSEVMAAFIDGLAQTIEDDAATHRLWYDIRSQAMFDESFAPIVGEIEKALIAIIDNLLRRLGVSSDPVDLYTAIDGRFRYCLQNFIERRVDAIADFRAGLGRILQAIR